jgi:glycosyltransferase involved in cell wall biosynthesis
LLFSVIIPTYNRATRLERTLESLVAQTHTDFEVIVCDDGSTDNTKEVTESFKNRLQLQYLWGENWGGPARPRNLGITAAQAEWICFLDSDDWWYPNKLEVVSGYLDNSDVIYHDLDIISSGKTPGYRRLFTNKTKARIFNKPIFEDLMLNDAGIPNSSTVVRKSRIIAVGGLTEDKDLIAVEDLDLWLKLSRVTEKFMYIPQSLGAYWVDGANISEISDKQIARLTALHDRHVNYLNEVDKKQALALLNYNIGRIKYKNGCLIESIELLRRATGTRSNTLTLKASITIFMAYAQTVLKSISDLFRWIK